jgi:NAD(P)-dependent dehydrogenase (short-subunit alcohol dehydrogenase family)
VEKVVIVTGTSRGLGKAFAHAALEAGHKVVGTDRKPQAMQEFERLRPGAASARVLVFFVKDKGVPPTVYLEPHNSSTETVHYDLAVCLDLAFAHEIIEGWRK